MNVSVFLVCATLLAPQAAASSTAAGPDHALVAAFERLHGTKSLDDAAGGRLLLGELNCSSCHVLDAGLKDFITPKTAPVLTGVGDRIRAEWFRKLLADPQHAKPGTTMPDVFAGLAPPEKEQKVEALTHFLVSTAASPPWDRFVDKSAAGRGEKTFHEIGCAACHGSRMAKVEPLPFAVPLGDPAAKYTATTLGEFLNDPLKTRPSGRMPKLNLTADQVRDLAGYFMKDVEAEPNFAYEYYEGRWDKLPDLKLFKPKKTGKAVGLDLSLAAKQNNFAFRFTAYFKLEKDGNLPVRLVSDDGSRMLIDDVVIVENDGIHPPQDKEAKAVLKPGVHKLVIEYFDAGGGVELSADWRTSGKDTWQPFGAIATLTPDGTPPGAKGFKLDPKLVDAGRELFASVGCASCHELSLGKQRIASTLKAKKLGQLPVDGGCTSDKPTKTSPHFALSVGQRKALAAAQAWATDAMIAGKPAPLPPTEKLKHTLATLNCYACHRRDNIGGVDMTPGLDLNDDGVPDVDPAAERLGSLFLGAIPEMGDEGRLPPKLDHVGAKLSENWLKQTLEKGAKERPYMKTVMPMFGRQNTDKLAALFIDLDHPVNAQPVEFTEPPYRVKADGRLMVGTKGVSCVKCHNFKNEKAEGIPGIDLTILAKRVRPEWFTKYLRDPQQIRPGTRMPTVFPGGKSPLPDVLGGDVDKQIAAIWSYLSDGDKAATPIGVGGQPIELVASTEPVLYRNFISDVGPRAIGVGYPEKANLAFDADDLRLGLIWHGAFIDAAKHWTGRGQGFQPPLGDDVVKLAAHVNLAQLKDAATPWPTQTARELGYQFRGYRLDAERRPTFLYDIGAARVEDGFKPVKTAKQPSLVRTLALTAESSASAKDVWFRAAEAKSIKPLADGWFEIEGLWKVRVASGSAKPVVRSSEKGQEIVLPVEFDGGKATIVQEFNW
jgi:mono/diheme cytochrome c family protein